MGLLKSSEQYTKEIIEKYNGLILPIGEYVSDNKNMFHQCTKCKFEWKIIPSNALSRQVKCPSCKALKFKEKNIKELASAHPNISFSDFKKVSDEVNAHCDICNNTWECTFSLVKFYGCRKCETILKHKERKDDNSFGIFYRVLFTNKKDKYSFVKIGITTNSVQQRYRNGGYVDFDFEILSQDNTTLQKARILELEYKREHIQDRFYFPDNVQFDGHTECYMVDTSTHTTSKSLIAIRNSMIENQNGVCPLCDNPIISPVCDHHHTGAHKGDGKIRGVVCSVCNSIVGKFENAFIRYGVDIETMPKFLENMLLYHSKQSPFKTNYIYPTEKPKVPKLMKYSFNELVRAIKEAQKIGKYKKKIPLYPKSKKMTKQLKELYEEFNIEPKFYAKKGKK